MTDENTARFEQMEQTTQKLKEMLLKNHEEHREQMASLMEIVLQMTKKKATTEGPIPTEVATRSGIIQEEPLCPPGSIPTHMQPSQGMCPLPNITPLPTQTTQETGPIPSPPAGASTFPHVIPSMGGKHMNRGNTELILGQVPLTQCWCMIWKNLKSKKDRRKSLWSTLRVQKHNKSTNF